MLKSVKPCLNCGSDKTSDYKEYKGLRGYEAIICKTCGYIYDNDGVHEPATLDKNSTMYVSVDKEIVERRKNIRDSAFLYFEACQEALNALNQIPNKKIRGKYSTTYELCSHLDSITAGLAINKS